MASDHYVFKTIAGCRVRMLLGRPEQDQDQDLVRLIGLSARAMRNLEGATVVSEGPHGTVYRLQRERGRPTVYWKEFSPRSWLDPIKDRLRGSKASRAWHGNLRLQQIGIFTARPLAYGEAPMRGLFRHARSFIITEEIRGAQSVREFLESLRDEPTPEQLAHKRMIMRELGHTVGRLHQAELYHADLRLENILWRAGKSGRPRLYLTDTDRVVRGLPLRERRIVRNLMQLNLFFLPGMTLSDRGRLLCAYADERFLDTQTRDRIATLVFAKLRRRLARHLGAGERAQLSDSVAAGMARLLKALTPTAKTSS